MHAPGDVRAEARARAYAMEQSRANEWHEADYSPGSPLRQAILNWAMARSGMDSQAELALP